MIVAELVELLLKEDQTATFSQAKVGIWDGPKEKIVAWEE